MTTPTEPSKITAWILRALTSTTDADAVIGDVVEDLHRSRVRSSGRAWGRLSLEWRLWQLIAAAALTSLGRALRSLRHMIRDAGRSLRRSPATTAFMVVVLTVSIAAATVTFSVVDTVVLRPLPFMADQELVALEFRPSNSTTFDTRAVAPSEYFAFRDRIKGMASMGAVEQGHFTLRPIHKSEPLVSARASASLFDVLGVRPLIGRTFTTADETDDSSAAVLSYEAWQRRFGADRGIVGRSIEVSSTALMGGGTTLQSLTVIGVMPRGFTYPLSTNYRTTEPQRTEIWTPLHARPTDATRYLHVVGRLLPGVHAGAAQSQINAIAAATATGNTATKDGATLRLVSLKDRIIGPVKDWMLLTLIAVGLVLLIACVNVANLQLTRAAYRARELSIRASLGASRRHVIVSLLVESLILSLGSAGLAIVLSAWGIDVARTSLPPGIARAEEIGLDLRVLTAAIVAAVTTGVFFGLVPAWQASRQDLISPLKQGSTTIGVGRERWRGIFTVIQVAVISVLLVAAALIVFSFIRVTTADLGFNRSDLLVVSPTGVPNAVRQDVLNQLRRLPGVSSASAVDYGSPPLMAAGFGGGASGTMVRAVGAPAGSKPLLVEYRRVSPDYFVSGGLTVVKGHVTGEAQDGASGAVVIDETTALALFGRRDATGAELTGSGRPVAGRQRVVAVVRDVRSNGPENTARPQIYIPASDLASGEFVVRIDTPTNTVIPGIRALLAPWQPAGSGPAEIRSVEDAFRNITADRRFNAALMALFGVLAIFIGAAGVYGVMASIVAQRTREIGVRVALGATTNRVIAAVIEQAVRYVVIGLLVGLPVAFGVSRIFRSLLFEVANTDWQIYATVAGVVLAIGLLAAFRPALRAARVDPLVALRTD
jgi:predicted permease